MSHWCTGGWVLIIKKFKFSNFIAVAMIAIWCIYLQMGQICISASGCIKCDWHHRYSLCAAGHAMLNYEGKWVHNLLKTYIILNYCQELYYLFWKKGLRWYVRWFWYVKILLYFKNQAIRVSNYHGKVCCTNQLEISNKQI